MKPEIAKIWVDALRSGKYTQGRQALKFTSPDDGKCYHCCLGVLCELYDKYNEEKLEQTGTMDIYFNDENMVLPEKVREWAGLCHNEGLFKGGGKSLSKMNDTGYSFEQIADTIEKNVERL